ncbi:hypothetical protein BCR35DRAFT_309395 [Leucosporidium creatinivorum]|uniref:Uncharacterized protein n=1 Tax=Leucosporidium creatinivorum TaxID=106004 RepID=A0A1Y2DHE8_9BASI|nr:hypothetical protein BCR35DRAFT_309395 [Leucosporidium creatinivorum]
MSTLPGPSPSKRATREMITELATGSDPRGSLQRAASNSTAQFNASIVEKAMKARQAVQRGQLGMPPPPPPASTGHRRPLGPSQSTPVLNFGGSAPFVTTNSTLSSVFGDVKRNELQPFFNNLHEDEAERSRRSASQRSLEGSGLFGGSAGGYQTRETTAMDEEEGDGFDMDEVFGESSIKFPSAFSSQPSFGGQEESQSSTGTTRTITQRMKRAFDDGEEGKAGADSDEEMAATDVEDEGGDVVQPSISAFNAPVGRKIGGRRGLSKTQSLPASVFNGADF